MVERLSKDEPMKNYLSVEDAADLSSEEVDRLIRRGYAVAY